MSQTKWKIVGVVLAILAITAMLVMFRHVDRSPAPTPAASATTTPAIDPSTLSIYTSGEYGFSLFYPEAATLKDAFTGTSTDTASWRVHADASGTPVVQISRGNEELRVGVSSNKGAVQSCTEAGPAEEARGTFVAGTIIWHEFMFQKIGTEEERDVTSYRTVHAGNCYAVEVLEPLQKSTAPEGYSLQQTITSFTFAS